MGIRRKIAKKRTFSFAIFTEKKYNYFLNLQFFLQRFFFFYILSYQSDSLTSTKNQLSNTNPPESPSKMTKKNVRFLSSKYRNLVKTC